MDFMKVIDQTVREIKREVNLKVLKVPEIEQKVLDATENEPWGPHGSALAEIAQATKKFSECQLVMNVLWTRLSDTGRDWRHVYKALAVIEYLVANGSERAVDDIIEHTFQISSLSGFEHVESSGKDVGINVRKKVETVVGLLNDKDKIQAVRNKATTNRDKYFGLSSSGVTYKSGSASYDNSSGFGSNDRYGGQRRENENDTFKKKYRVEDQKHDRDTSTKSFQGGTGQNHGISTKGATHHKSKKQDSVSSSSKNPLGKSEDSDKHKSLPSPTSNVNNYEDDFDPRGTSTNKSVPAIVDQIDLFGESLVENLMDTPTAIQSEPSESDADLFADAAFVSASAQAESEKNTRFQRNVDLFALQPPIPSTSSSAAVDLFATSHPIVQSQSNPVDPFAALPLNDFNESDPFGAFVSNPDSDSFTRKPLPDAVDMNSDGNPKTMNTKPVFQVKSGIWADTLSRGLIDLNIAAAPSTRKVSCVGGGSGWEKGKATSSGITEQDLFSSFKK